MSPNENRCGEIGRLSKGVKAIVALSILLVALAAAALLVKTRKAPQKEVRPPGPVPVEVALVRQASDLLPIKATGTVQPKYEVDLVAQVSGLVVWIDPDFVRGRFFDKGELLFRIDETDYVSALEAAKAQLTKAKLDLETIKAKAEIARREWQLMEHPPEEKPLPLVFYEPQQENAKQLVASAQAKVKKAETDLARTRITAPFNCYVRSESVELGQYVRSGSKVATLVFSDQAEIVLPVQERYIPWLQAADESEGIEGSPVDVMTPGLGRRQTGQLERIAPYVDSKTRLVDLFVVVDDPFCRRKQGECVPLPVGTFVEAVIHGRTPPGAVIVPAAAVRSGGRVYLVNSEERLEIVPVQLIHLDGVDAWVLGDLTPGQQVVISPMRGAAPGMRLKAVASQYRDRSLLTATSPEATGLQER